MNTKHSHIFFSPLIALLLTLLLAACRDVPYDGQTVLTRDGMTYRGGISNGKYEGYGQLSIGDSVIYAGQWHMGKRSGKGVCHDSLGHRIVGTWRADTLVSGTRTDSTGTYSGTMNRDAIADGYGLFTSPENSVYLGDWVDGKRTGFGFAMAKNKRLRVGEWRADR